MSDLVCFNITEYPKLQNSYLLECMRNGFTKLPLEKYLINLGFKTCDPVDGIMNKTHSLSKEEFTLFLLKYS